MPLKGCIRLSHFLFLIFKPVFEHLTGREATLTNWMERECQPLIQPCYGTTSYSHASNLNHLVQKSPMAVLGRITFFASATPLPRIAIFSPGPLPKAIIPTPAVNMFPLGDLERASASERRLVPRNAKKR